MINVNESIQKLKEFKGQHAESIIANGLCLDKRGTNYRCFNSHMHKNNDRTPSMSWDSNLLRFKCFTCNSTLDIYGYYREEMKYSHNDIMKELNISNNDLDKRISNFQSECKKAINLDDKSISYLESRGLSKDTINHFRIKMLNGMIAFPYYQHEIITGYKLRKPLINPGNPKMQSVTGSKFSLFNSQNLNNDYSELIICEGEIDSMTVYECGFKNVVSVGTGANSLNALFENERDFLNKYENLIIVSDNDQSGMNMDEIFLKEFGDKVKFIDKTLYSKNDINEELLLNDKFAVKKIIESGISKIEGLRNLEANPFKGIAQSAGKYIPIGLPTIDEALNQLAPGRVTLIAGRANAGKTVLTKQIIANAISNDNKVFLISGEGDQEMYLSELYQCVIGRNRNYCETVKVNIKFHTQPVKEILESLKEWHKDKLILFDKKDSNFKNTDQLFKMIAKQVKLKKYNLVVFDNLMSLLSASSSEMNSKQADFVQRLHELASSYNTHIILILHPNKQYNPGVDMEFEMISGSSDMANKADNILSVVREYDELKRLSESRDGRIRVLKNRYYSELPEINVKYDKYTGQLMEIKDGVAIGYNFNLVKYIKPDFMSRNRGNK